jgi:PST family polysaccharide transporter
MSRGRALLRNGVVRNALGLYVMQFGQYLLPIATVMILARRLGPTHWGSLVFMQAFASYVTFLVNYGFNYSATREVARNSQDKDRLADLVAGVVGAKLALAVASMLLVLPVAALVPPVHRNAGLLWPAMLWAISIAASPAFYFQGLERLGVVARFDTVARVLSLVVVVLVVAGPADTWKVLAVQGGLLSCAVLVELAVVYREVGFRVSRPRLVRQSLRLGWAIFMLTGALSFYTIGNGFVLGLFGTPAAVAYYVGAERICRVFGTLLSPITQAVFPRTSHLASRAPAEAARLARNSLLVMTAVACPMGVVLFAGAPILVHVLLGPGFESAIPVLRILSLLPPLIAASNVLGVQWGLALGLDRLVNLVMFGAGVLNVSLAFLLVPHYSQIGMAMSVVAAELSVVAGLYVTLRLKRLDPFTMAVPSRADAPAVLSA